MGRNTKGGGPVTFADAGKTITRERDTVAFRDAVPLQGRVPVKLAEALVAEEEVHVPAVAAVVAEEVQHAQEEQPSVCSAEEAQQQPPKHMLVPQSAFEAHASPGELRMQEPEPKLHAWQPCRAALGEQQ